MKYLKLNDNDNHLSLGNLFNEIKNNSINKSSAIQTELFCIIFSIDNISETTVNNYCTGYRSIGNDYKQIYLNYKNKYQKNKNILIPIINNLISIMEGTIKEFPNTKDINQNNTIKNLSLSLQKYLKNDIYVPKNFKNNILNLLKEENYYEIISEILFYTILEKKQPIYNKDLINSTIEEILINTNISPNDLKEYLELEFKEGISLIPSLKILANKNNPYALYKLGNLEYEGLITGEKDYEKAYNYHLKAASFNHPTSCWMISHMIINKKIGSLSDDDINLAWNYLLKAERLNSVSSLNTIGLCYLNGINPTKEINIELAIKYFKKAEKQNYVYAFNNLGKIYENKKDFELAYNYYLKSANQENSWACNKIAEFYRQGIYVKKDLSISYQYYLKGANSPISTRDNWNIYNLVKHFYLEGNANLGIKKDINKSISLLETIKDFPPAQELLLYSYYELYLITNKKEELDKVNFYLSLLNNNPNINIKKRNIIQDTLNNISKKTILPHT